MNIIATVVNEADDLVDTGTGAEVVAIAVILIVICLWYFAYKRS